MLASRLVMSGAHATAHAAFTDRRGGYSAEPYASFNLALHVGDSTELVSANRSLLGSVLGLQADRLSFTDQVHGTTVHRVTASDGGASLPRTVVAADAQVTTAAGIGLVVLVADCTPVLLADPDAGVIAAVHAGRRGMADGVVPAAIEAMHAAGAQQVRAVVGPSVCPRCYEVPSDLRTEVASREPVTASVAHSGAPSLDVSAGVVEQLRRAGAHVEHWESRCTYEDPELFSYRREGVTGRFAGVIWMESGAGAAEN